MTQKNDIYRLYWVVLVIGGLFFNGSAKAQETRTGVNTRNPQGILHVDGKGDNPKNTAPTAQQAANDVLIDDKGFIGVGTLNPKVKLDLRSVVDYNAFGLGTTNLSAATAEEGAIRYEANEKKIQSSDGVNWITTIVPPTKAVVVARMGNSFSVAKNQDVVITGWDEIHDLTNSFNPSTGQFTAPRDGVYSFMLTFNFVTGDVAKGSQVEVQFARSNGTILARSYKTFGKSMRPTQAGGAANITLSLKQGDVIVPRIRQNITLSGSRSLRTHTDYSHPNGGFNNLTIIEY